VGALRVHPLNIEPIILPQKIEDLREAEAVGLAGHPLGRFGEQSARKQDSREIGHAMGDYQPP
jgi:hypothetical protein